MTLKNIPRDNNPGEDPLPGREGPGRGWGDSVQGTLGWPLPVRAGVPANSTHTLREFMLKVRPKVPLTIKVDEAQDRPNEDSGNLSCGPKQHGKLMLLGGATAIQTWEGGSP